MPDEPGFLEKLWKAFQEFFLRIIRWILSPTARETDPEARLNLSTEIIYGEKIPAWVTEPPKNSTNIDGQPLRHSEEWAQQKAAFLRSPVLKRKYGPDEAILKEGQESGPRARFSEFPVEYSRTPSGVSSQGFSLPPIIRIEDWSTLPSPGTFPATAKSLTLVTTSFSRSEHVSSPQRDSLAVPSQDSPGFFRTRTASKISKHRKTVIVGNPASYDTSHSDGVLDPDPESSMSVNHDRARKSSLIQSPNAPRSTPDQSHGSLSSIRRPARTSSPVLTSSLLDLLDASTLPENEMGFDFTRSPRRSSAQRSQSRSQKSSERRFTPKRHHSHPLSTTSIAPLRDNVGHTTVYPSQMRKEGPNGEVDYYRHSIDVVGLPFPLGIRLSSDVETAILTRFHEKGLAMTPEKTSSGFRRRLVHPSSKLESSTSTTTDSSNPIHIPYPYVFDFDDYFRDLTPPPSPPICIESTSESSSSRNGSRQSFDTPTPAPRSSSTTNIRMMTCSSDLARLKSTSRPSSIGDRKIQRLLDKTATPTRISSKWSSASDSDEEEYSLSFSEYSDQVDNRSSSGDLPLTQWIANRRKGVGASSRRTEVLCEPSAPSSINPGRKSVSPNASNEMKMSPNGRMDEHPEMEKIRASLRSHYTFTQRLRDSYKGDGNDDSAVSLVESYSSGSTLSHHYHPHYWKVKGATSRAEERTLDPLIEASSESEPSYNSKMTSTPKPTSSQDSQAGSCVVAVNRTPRPPPPWVLPPRRSEANFKPGRWSQMQSKSLNDKKYRDTSWTKTSCTDTKMIFMGNEGSSRTRGTSCGSVLAPGSSSIGGMGKPLLMNAGPSSPTGGQLKGRRVMPQKF